MRNQPQVKILQLLAMLGAASVYSPSNSNTADWSVFLGRRCDEASDAMNDVLAQVLMNPLATIIAVPCLHSGSDEHGDQSQCGKCHSV